MFSADDIEAAKANPHSALISVVDEMALANEALNAFITLVLDHGTGREVSLPREGVANLLRPLLCQYRQSHALLCEARVKLKPTSRRHSQPLFLS